MLLVLKRISCINALRAALDLFLLKPDNELEMDGMNSFQLCINLLQVRMIDIDDIY